MNGSSKHPPANDSPAPWPTDAERPYAVVRSDGSVEWVSKSFEQIFGRAILGSPLLREVARNPGTSRLRVPGERGYRELDVIRLPEFERIVLLGIDAAVRQELATLRQRVTELEHLSLTDRLTGAWNRRHLESIADTEIHRASRQRQPLSLILLDIDYFKDVNDRFGHTAGDAVLVEFVQRVQNALRPMDSLFRWGGEEFVVVAPSCGFRSAGRIARRLQTVISAQAFPQVGAITVSAGVAQHLASECFKEWFERADAALYAAKQGGRNRVELDPRGEHGLAGMGAGEGVLELLWREDYESGDTQIDSEHRELFALANQVLETALHRRAGADQHLTSLDSLIEHIREHFDHEERILAQVGYPRLEQHRKLHSALLTRATDLRAEVRESGADLGRLMEFLVVDVVSRHTLKADRDFFPFLENSTPPDALQSSTTATADPLSVLQERADIDPSIPLAAFGGQTEVYLGLLEELLDYHSTEGEALRDELHAMRWTDLRKRAHSLRGAAAALGAVGLARAANALEQAVAGRTPTPDAEKLLALIPAVENQLRSLRAALTECATERRQTPPDSGRPTDC